VTDGIGSNTLMGCGSKVATGEPATSERGPRPLFPSVPGSSAGGSSLDSALQDQS